MEHKINFTPDSYIIYDFLGENGIDHDVTFAALKQEMTPYYIPRPQLTFKGKQLARDKAFFATYQANRVPYYLYPSDHRPQANSFTLAPILTSIRDAVNMDRDLDGPKQVNHCVANYYQNGLDHITAHNDKTSSWVMGTNVYNVSLGAPRTIRLHYQPDGVGSLKPWDLMRCGNGNAPQWTYKDVEGMHGPINVVMLPGSLFVLGWVTNAYFQHEIVKDKKCTEPRFGLTFRSMAETRPRTNKLLINNVVITTGF
jgi:hypothetical protein